MKKIIIITLLVLSISIPAYSYFGNPFGQENFGQVKFISSGTFGEGGEESAEVTGTHQVVFNGHDVVFNGHKVKFTP